MSELYQLSSELLKRSKSFFKVKQRASWISAYHNNPHIKKLSFSVFKPIILSSLSLSGSDHECRLTPYQFNTGNFRGYYSNIELDDVTACLGETEPFQFKDDIFEVNTYNIEILYRKTYDWSCKGDCYYNPSWNIGCDCMGKRYVNIFDGKAIIRIKDATGRPFFMYMKLLITGQCVSCDGQNTDHVKRIIYSRSLDMLLKFVYTPKQMRKMYQKLLVQNNKEK